MTVYIARRLLGAIPTFLGVLTVVFIVMRLVPGDPALLILGDEATPAALAAVRADLGLDRPLVAQYVAYLGDVLRGDFGRSLRTNRPVVAEVLRVLPYTAMLATAGILIGCLIGIAAGVVSALRRNTYVDYIASALATAGLALPVFTIGILLLVVFSYNLRWFPVLGAGDLSSWPSVLHHLALPAIAVGTSAAATIARMTRSSVLEVLSQDYVRTARAKGLASAQVTRRHVMKNSMIPVVTLIGLSFGRLMSGTVITETLFVRPGLGRLLIDSIYTRDYPQVEVTVATFALMFILINLVVDLTYAVLDPRIQYA